MKWTEKQIEAYLESETREIVGSDGRPEPVTLFHMYWVIFDGILMSDNYTAAILIDWAREVATREQTDVITALETILEFADRRFKHHYYALN
jgi:hypothetical protein